MSKPVIVDLFYDVRSPFSWIGFEALTRYNKKFPEMQLRLRPISLVIVGRATGNSTPMDIPAKARYMAKDLQRLAEYFNLPFHLPKDVRNVMFVKGTHAALCLLTVVSQKHPEYLEELSRVFSLRIWSRDEDVTSEKSLKEACREADVPDEIIQLLIDESQTKKADEDLRKTCDKALEHGAFGVPTYVAHYEDGPKMFFGTDRLYMLCYYLKVPYPGSLNELKSSKL